MKVEFTFLERAYHANMLRARAVMLSEIAAERTGSASKQELTEEARWCEARARKLDECEEPATVSEKEPARVNQTRDIIEEVKPEARA